MGKTPEEIEHELSQAKSQAALDENRRKAIYAEAELDILRQEKRMEALKLFINIVQKYGIVNDDLVVLLENVPYI